MFGTGDFCFGLNFSAKGDGAFEDVVTNAVVFDFFRGLEAVIEIGVGDSEVGYEEVEFQDVVF